MYQCTVGKGSDGRLGRCGTWTSTQLHWFYSALTDTGVAIDPIEMCIKTIAELEAIMSEEEGSRKSSLNDPDALTNSSTIMVWKIHARSKPDKHGTARFRYCIPLAREIEIALCWNK